MNLLFLCGFNNYANRKIIKYSSVTDYQNAVQANHYAFLNNINFNPNDGVSTEQIVNWTLNTNAIPDYVVAFEEDSTTHVRTIVHTWFIMDWTRTRDGQYKATLRRDVVSDHYTDILNSPCFVERGPISSSDPLLFNSEGLSLNQIKKSETLLKDETGEAWIVGYMYRSDNNEEEVVSVFNADTYPTPSSLGIVIDERGISYGGTVKAITNNYEFYLFEDLIRAYDGQHIAFYDGSNYKIRLRKYLGTNIDLRYGFYEWIYGNNEAAFAVNMTNDASNLLTDFNARSTGLESTLRSQILAANATLHPTYTTYENYLEAISGKTVLYNNKYYRVNLVSNETSEVIDYYDNTQIPGPYSSMSSVTQSLEEEYGRELLNISRNYYLGAILNVNTASLSFEEVNGPNTEKVTIKGSRNKLDDAPYDMFCLKYNLANLALAQRIAEKLTKSKIYDLQILPYNPARFAIGNNNLINDVDYSSIKNSDNVEIDKLYYCKHSSDTFMIDTSISIPSRDNNEKLNKKLSNECDYWRLTSPNYSSSFEFNVSKNGGISAFQVDFTYRPISPYVRISPILSGLYGDVTNDARGLILQGDFSIDTISDHWQEYQVQNKNYENIFNAKIKSMDYQHSQSMISAGIGMGTSMAKGVIGGMLSGKTAGSVLGATAGLISGITNVATTENKYKDQRQLDIDLYNYQLGNVKALPDTLSKISAYNISNKYFPMVEYYTCSDTEVEMVKKLLKYRSYKQMRITTIGDLPFTTEFEFVKGEMIWVNIENNDRMANEIYNEIYKGVYL